MTSYAIDRQTVQTLSAPSNLKSLRDLVLAWGVIVTAMTAAHVIDRWYVYAVAIVVIGARQNALATLAHEGWHGLIFTSRRLNHTVGAWLYAYPLGILYFHDRDRHLRHHRDVGHNYDPDWINYTNRGRESGARVLGYLMSLLCGRLLFSTILSIVTKGRPRIGVESRENRPTVLGKLFPVLACQAVLFALMTLATHRWWTYPLLWMLPLATFAGFFANFRALIEHVATRDNVAPGARLRDIEAGAIERFFISPSHFNYHALHHAHPSIPHYNLTRGKAAYLKQFGLYPFTVWHGYTRGLFSYLRELHSPM